MGRKIKIRDVTLRDGQQSQFATRMTQEQIDRVLPYFKEANFYAMEVWGGAVPDSTMRFLAENPWDRLKKIKAGIGKSSKLTALSRGRNLFGYNPYPNSVIEGFCKEAVKEGIDIMRIFDALNDLDNMKSTIEFVKKNGGIADCAVCYTVDSKFSFKDRMISQIQGKPIPKEVFNMDYFVNKAKEMEKMGADMVSIKDMAGLITPQVSATLIKRMKEELKIPIDFHSHCTPGFGLASAFMAIINGVDIVDTVLWSFAGGPAGPAYELVHFFCEKAGIETDVNMKSLIKINDELRNIRKELAEYDKYKDSYPIELKINTVKEKAEPLFDEALEYAKEGNAESLLNCCHKIEAIFNFPKPNEEVRKAQIPGGMYTNMTSQLSTLKLSHLENRVLQMVPKVRWDAGSPPLVTPSSQIVGAQAVNCVLDENNEKPLYTSVSTQFFNLVKGSYGNTPLEIDPEFREMITGESEFQAFKEDDYNLIGNEILKESEGGGWLAQNVQEELLIELFPNVAKDFLKNVIKKKIKEEPQEQIKNEEDIFWEEVTNYS